MTGYELLIRAAGTSPRAAAVGDVIAAAPVGHAWGREDLSNPDWRVVRVAGLPPAMAYSLTAPEPRRGPFDRATRARGLTVDVAGLDALTGGLLLGPRSAAPPDASLSYSDFAPLVSVKPRPRGRGLLGPSRQVIG